MIVTLTAVAHKAENISSDNKSEDPHSGLHYFVFSVHNTFYY